MAAPALDGSRAAIGCLVFIAIFTYRSFDVYQRAIDV
jgi:hypothetical protein